MVDPVTLTGLALTGLATGVASSALSSSSSAPPPSPTAPPAPASAPPTQTPAAKPTGGATQQPSFVGASSVPSSDMGQKTLVGQ